jgi:hypothetical protein
MKNSINNMMDVNFQGSLSQAGEYADGKFLVGENHHIYHMVYGL